MVCGASRSNIGCLCGHRSSQESTVLCVWRCHSGSSCVVLEGKRWHPVHPWKETIVSCSSCVNPHQVCLLLKTLKVSLSVPRSDTNTSSTLLFPPSCPPVLKPDLQQSIIIKLDKRDSSYTCRRDSEIPNLADSSSRRKTSG